MKVDTLLPQHKPVYRSSCLYAHLSTQYSLLNSWHHFSTRVTFTYTFLHSIGLLRREGIWPYKLHWGATVWKSLNGISPLDDVHQRYTRDLSYSPPKVFITSCNNIALVRSYSVDETVVRICASMSTHEALKSWVSGDTKTKTQSQSNRKGRVYIP